MPERPGLATVDVGPAASGVTVLPRGTVVGDYVLDGVLAQGGFGLVYRARDRRGHAAAVKVLHAELCSAPNAVARFLREAEVMVRVRHPNVVELLSWGTVDDGRPFLAMELLTGTDLAKVMARSGRLAPERALAVLEAICDALAVSHAQNIIHRDIKASNVFLAETAGGGERVVLIDFGIAKLAAPDATDLTTSRQMVGTPVTMAPEQITGAGVDARTDVYGLGVLAFHLLTGRLPFEDESPTIVQYLHAHARRPKASGHAPLPAKVDDVVARAMAIDPAQRYPDAPSFAAALRGALHEQSADEAALEPRPAIAILVEVRADPDAMDEPDDALLTDLESLLPSAEQALAAAGYPAVFHSGNLLLTARPAGADDAAARAAAIDEARAVAARLDARPDRDPRVGFVVAVHFGTALCAGDAIRAGDLTDVAYWTPDPAVRGTVATRAALDGLPILSSAVSDSRVYSVG